MLKYYTILVAFLQSSTIWLVDRRVNYFLPSFLLNATTKTMRLSIHFTSGRSGNISWLGKT